MTSRDRAASAAPPSQLSLFAEAVAQSPTSLDFAAPDGAVTRADNAAASLSPSLDFPGSSGASSNTPPAAKAPSLPMQAIFRHPQAEREIRFGEHVVAYALRRAKRRSIGFIVGAEGLSVNAPKWVGVGDIEAALREKSTWILRKLREQQERAQRLQAAKVDWRDGTSIPYLGENIIVVLDPRAGVSEDGAVLNTDSSSGPDSQQSQLAGLPQLTLHIGLPHTATPAQIRDAVQSWLQRQAKRVFADRCHHFADQLGVRFTRLTLSSAQTRWGSASADGSIRLNWRLIHFALPTIDYVVTHELAHLREMNHSPRFWDVVRSVMPDYEKARGTLKDDAVPVFD
jgi:predicted metal-dependent hydrolase